MFNIERRDPEECAIRRICADCVGEPYLKREIKSKGKAFVCSYCSGKRKTIQLDELCRYVNQAFEDHYEPAGYGYDGEPKGEGVVDVIQGAAGIDYDPACDLQAVLEDQYGPVGKDAVIEDNPYSEEVSYQERGISIYEYMEEWDRFRKSLLTEARLFNGEAESILGRIFDGIEEYGARHGKQVFVDAGPGKRIKAFFRARAFHSDEKLKAAIARPDVDLGPPPSQFAIAGRMNAHGIGVFYGATHCGVAIAEIRPPVGSRVLVGRFEIIRSLRLLDVGAMGAIRAKGSLFDPEFVRELERAAFLGTLSQRITQPVMPDDEPSEYLVTQAIADYLATRTDPVLDGILYPSVQQNGNRKRNVVLFHKSSCVAELDLPTGSRIDAHLYEQDEGDRYPGYSVLVRKPPPRKKDEVYDGLFDVESVRPFRTRRTESREASLKVDLPSVKVHHVTAVRFSDEQHSIRRHELQMSEAEAEGIARKHHISF